MLRRPAGRATVLLTAVAVVAGPVGAGAAAAGPPAAPAVWSSVSVATAGFGWPLAPPPAVVRPFQPPARPFGPGHRGVDLAGAPGQLVLAAGDGVVLYAAPLAGRGVVSMLHPDGLRTTYEPVTAGVRAGTVLRRGAVLGRLDAGHPGCPAGCLHWGVLRDEEYLDPLVLVAPVRVRLLPWPDDR